MVEWRIKWRIKWRIDFDIPLLEDKTDGNGDEEGSDDEDIMEAIWSLVLVREVSGGFFPNCSGRTRHRTVLS